MNHLFSSMTVLVQRSMAQIYRLARHERVWIDHPVLNYYSKPIYGFTVSNNCFYPKPKVQSAVVKFELQKPPLVSNEEGLFTLIHTAFEHRRKMLRSLKNIYPADAVTEALQFLNLNPLARPEELSLSEFIALFKK